MEFMEAMPLFPSWAESLIQGLSDLLLNHPRPVVMIGLVYCISHIVFQKMIDPQLYDFYSKYFVCQSNC